MQALKLPRAKRKIELGQSYECVRAVGRRFAIALALMCAIGVGAYSSPVNAMEMIVVYGDVHCPFSGSVWMGNMFLHCTYGGGGGGSGGGDDGGYDPPPGAGGTPVGGAIPESEIPDLNTVKCIIDAYGADNVNAEVHTSNVWAFHNSTTGDNAFSSSSSTPPAGYSSLHGEVKTVGGVKRIVIYADGMTAKTQDFGIQHRDITTDRLMTTWGPFSALEWMVVTLGHEVAHIEGIGPEKEATGYGMYALDLYRQTGGGSCD